MSLPGADDLFRRTADGQAGGSGLAEVRPVHAVPTEPEPAEAVGSKRPSGRVRHDEKVTVYLTSEELLDLEQARLSIRRSHGLAVDRGRLVREAVALCLADLEAHGEDSALLRRLTEE